MVCSVNAFFGPTKDWECHCGRYKRIRHKGIVCEKCGVEVTVPKYARERMGYIGTGSARFAHLVFQGNSFPYEPVSWIFLPRALEKVLYFASFIVTDPGETSLEYKQLLSDKEYREAIENFGEGSFKAGMGAEAIKILLQELDLMQLPKA